MKNNIDNDGRKIRGYAIISKGDIPERLSSKNFFVHSQSGKGKYQVYHNGTEYNNWLCSCPDFQKNQVACKHIYAVQFWLQFKKTIEQRGSLEIPKVLEPKQSCPYCNSESIIKRGIRKNDGVKKQRYLCKSCKKRFVDVPFKKTKGNAQIVTLVLDLYFKGVSLRKVKDHLLQFYNFSVTHVTIYNWIKRYMKLISQYTNTLQPKVSGMWNVDEQMIKAKNKYVYCWNAIDSQTRFLIANNITEERGMEEARQIFKKTKEVAKIRPDIIVTDGLQSYNRAIMKEYGTMKPQQTKHIRLESIRAHVNNNKVERYHNTFRERDKVMRGFKSTKTLAEMSDAYRAYYNYIRNHTTLGMTPAQKAGIDLKLGQNRWLDLIHKSV